MLIPWLSRRIRRRIRRRMAQFRPAPSASVSGGTTTPIRRDPAAGPVIRADALVKRYGALTAVDGISFSVAAGEVFGLLGPNGAGKTTTLEMLEGLRTPDGGKATVLGEPMPQNARAVKERIGVQLQATALPAYTKVKEAVELFAALFEQSRPADELLAQFDLTAKADTYASDLSGGQMQRLSLALALVNQPELVFLDEPTTGLDPAARLSLWGVIEEIRTRGTTVVLTTHYMEEAERLCDRVAVVDHGRIVALDTPTRLIAEHAPGTTVEFATATPVDPESLRTLPGVGRVEVDGDRISLTTLRPEAVLARIFDPAGPWAAPAAAGGIAVAAAPIRDLRVHGGTLEDVFLNLTGSRLRS